MRRRNSQWTTWSVISLPKLILLIAPLTVAMLGILVLAFQLNRQLADQQQVIVNRLAHAAVRHAGQLQREHLRLYALIAATTDTVDPEAFQLQWDLVESQIRVLRNTLDLVVPPPKVEDLYQEYLEHWQAIQPELDLWKTDPQNRARKNQILTEMTKFERSVNLMTTDLQLLFEDRMQSWADKSHSLNRLLTAGNFSFVIIILMMTYIIYLFFQNQEFNEKILRISERRLRVILETIPDAVYRISSSGIYTDYKPPTTEADLGTTDTVHGKHLGDLLPAEIAAMIQEGIQSVVVSGEQLLLEYPLLDPVTKITHRYEARLLPSSNEEVQLIVRDITDVKLQEEAALQAQKLESLGVLAGGIAHDFNNLLTGMLGQASLAAAKLNRGLPALDHIQKVVLSAERAADLTRQLLAYTGKGKFQIDPLNLNQLIRDTAALMGTVLPNQTKLVMALQEELPLVHVDRGQIQQVVMNLFINAIEALAEGEGTITITTGTEVIDGTVAPSQPASNGHSATRSELLPGTYVVLHVSDSGIGMEQSTLSRIFDPFFSTKPKGHGLGLSATMGIVRTHKGVLQVKSQLGLGTTFTMLLPAYTMEAKEQEVAPTALAQVATKNIQTVLIIDDEAPVREVATDILAGQGFRVATATNGLEGINLYRNCFQNIDLILLDMKMPGINGKETYQELAQIHPMLKVIFTSGYSETEISAQISQSSRVTFLPKPYSAELLTHQVHKMLAL